MLLPFGHFLEVSLTEQRTGNAFTLLPIIRKHLLLLHMMRLIRWKLLVHKLLLHGVSELGWSSYYLAWVVYLVVVLVVLVSLQTRGVLPAP